MIHIGDRVTTLDGRIGVVAGRAGQHVYVRFDDGGIDSAQHERNLRALGAPADDSMHMATVREVNEMGGAIFCGSFETIAAATAFARARAAKSRSFVRFEVWLGTPRHPQEPVEGEVYRGEV